MDIVYIESPDPSDSDPGIKFEITFTQELDFEQLTHLVRHFWEMAGAAEVSCSTVDSYDALRGEIDLSKSKLPRDQCIGLIKEYAGAHADLFRQLVIYLYWEAEFSQL